MVINDEVKTRRLLIRARQSIYAAIKECGGCDHEVGICVCADIGLVGEIDRLLFDACGMDLLMYFFDAEPTHTFDNPGEGHKWAKVAADIVRNMVSEKLASIVNPEE